MIEAFPKARTLLADRGYDADWFRAALAERGIATCIPSKINRKVPIPHDAALYRQRHKIENMFGKLKDWRRIHTRYDRCAHTFFSAICIAATVIFWLNQWVLSLKNGLLKAHNRPNTLLKMEERRGFYHQWRNMKFSNQILINITGIINLCYMIKIYITIHIIILPFNRNIINKNINYVGLL